MFTGIVQGMAPVVALQQLPGLSRITIELPEALAGDLSIGASIALNGVCMTVTGFNGRRVAFDAMDTTLQLTTLGTLKQGSRVNVERSARQGDELGGHIVSGHVDGVAEIVSVESSENNQRVTYQLPETAMLYLFNKGFISLDGCSLTIAAIDKAKAQISVSFIPETLRVTSHGIKGVGDTVNFEIDRQTQAIVDTVKTLLQENPDWLKSVIAAAEK
ncbi:MAG: riboflavin synthase [Gammaproteobacteria bacterium]|nr:MAG: riboflavin synthase [Gammaproteobacteria bacterium]